MASRVCLVHYHEVGLKGKNRAHFEHVLMGSIKAACAAFSLSCVTRISGHILVTFSDAASVEPAFEVIRRVPGVARVSLAYHTNRDPEEYGRAAVRALGEAEPFRTFKVSAKRSNTDYPLTSMDLNRQVGEVLCEAFPDKKVQMRDPDAVVNVLVVQGSVYVYARSERGVRLARRQRRQGRRCFLIGYRLAGRHVDAPRGAGRAASIALLRRPGAGRRIPRLPGPHRETPPTPLTPRRSRMLAEISVQRDLRPPHQ